MNPVLLAAIGGLVGSVVTLLAVVVACCFMFPRLSVSDLSDPYEGDVDEGEIHSHETREKKFQDRSMDDSFSQSKVHPENGWPRR